MVTISKMAAVLEMQSTEKGLALADVFAEDSDNERTFYGFSDTEISEHCDKNSYFKDEDEDEHEHEHEDEDISPKKIKAKSEQSSGARSFRLRVALRSTPITQQSTDDDGEAEEEEQRTRKMTGVKKAGGTSQAKRMKSVKFEDEGTLAAPPSPPEKHESDSEEDAAESFLAKRQQNIKANKAMLAQLMADLQKMPGGAGFLKKQAGRQKTKEKSSRPPRSGAAGVESRRNPERASRRLTRSMGGGEAPSPTKEDELELNLEEELLEVRQAPRRRGAPRPKQSKPHIIRPVEDITEDEIQLVADNMTDKVYNSVTGSTCHQCRQKTVDTKTCCRNEDCRGIQGQFCGPCLRNRYGEDVRKALRDAEWKCPPCRGICNCSFCRQRDGRCPTGILFPLAQYHGFSDVHSYLTSLRNKLKNEDNDVEM